jgi:kexin
MRLLNAAILVLASAAAAKPSKRSWSTHDYYVVEYDARSGATLSEVADALGVEVVERAGELKDHWLVRAPKTSGADAVLAARDSLHAWNARDSIGPHHTKRAALAIKYVEKQVLRQRVKRQGVPPEAPPQPDSPTRPVAPTTPDIPTRPVRPDVPAPSPTATGTSSHDVALRLSMQDPEFGKQWHLVNDEDPSHSMNVSGIWEMGITGRGVISALIDDGLDYTSDDLSANFVSPTIFMVARDAEQSATVCTGLIRLQRPR